MRLRRVLKGLRLVLGRRLNLFGMLKSRTDLEHYAAALRWIHNNTIENKGICITNKRQAPYPEVSGYFIPSLLQFDEHELAVQYANWLVSTQNANGSWSDGYNKVQYTFDTGQVLRGLLALVDSHPHFKKPIEKACNWVVSQVEESGRIGTPNRSEWSSGWLPEGRVVPEAIHLYALEPIKQAGEKWQIDDYIQAVKRVLSYYLADEELTSFSTLCHFHAYIIEALVDLGYVDRARCGMEEVAHLQRSNGHVPAYRDVRWTCATGLFQYAVIWYKLGNIPLADKSFSYACSLQNKSGGFFGGYGFGATYLPGEEISWAVKYFLDALWWKKKVHVKTDLAGANTSLCR